MVEFIERYTTSIIMYFLWNYFINASRKSCIIYKLKATVTPARNRKWSAMLLPFFATLAVVQFSLITFHSHSRLTSKTSLLATTPCLSRPNLWSLHPFSGLVLFLSCRIMPWCNIWSRRCGLAPPIAKSLQLWDHTDPESQTFKGVFLLICDTSIINIRRQTRSYVNRVVCCFRSCL